MEDKKEFNMEQPEEQEAVVASSIGNIVQEEFDKMIVSGELELRLRDNVKTMLTSAIDDAVKGYSLQSQIKGKINDEVSKAAAQADFSIYNSMVLKILDDAIKDVCLEDARAKFTKRINDLMFVKHDSFKLSELVDKYRDYLNNSAYIDQDEKREREYFHLDIEENDSYGWVEIKLAPKSLNGSRYYGDDCYEITLNKSQDTVIGGVDNMPVMKILALRFDGNFNIFKDVSVNHMSEFDLLLMNLAVNETPILVDGMDADDFDTSYDYDEY